jgi:hypothetical protein
MLADLQHNRGIVALGYTPLNQQLDSSTHAIFHQLPHPLESEEAPGFACEFLLGSTDVPSQEEEHRVRNLLNGQVLSISERFGAGIGHAEVLVGVRSRPGWP